MRRHSSALAIDLLLTLALAGLALLSLSPAPTAAATGWKTYPTRNGAAVVPVPADYSGDGLTDLAFYDPSTQNWHMLKSDDGYQGPDQLLLDRFGAPEARPLPADYDGDGRDDPAFVHLSAGVWRFAYRASRNGMAYFREMTFGSPAYTALTADVDGDGAADPLFYYPPTGLVYGLLSSQQFMPGPERTFVLNTGIAWGQPFVVDYDHGRAGANDRSGAYPRGRDFMDDIAVLGPKGTIYIFTSHYGLYNHQVTLPDFADRSDRPVRGDFDGDGILDLAVQRSVPEGSMILALLSNHHFDPQTPRALPVPPVASNTLILGHYDLDYQTDVAVYHQGEWHVRFSETAPDGLNNPPTTYPSHRFGMGMGNWDDSRKVCYEMELGVADSAEDEDNYAASDVIPCAEEMFFEAHGISEMAQTFTRDRVTYRLHPRAFTVAWGNYLDPTANATLFMFKYITPTLELSEAQRRNLLVYAHDIPGAIQVEFDLRQCQLDANGRCQDADGGRKLVYTDGSAIWRRAAFKQWLIDNRQGPVRDRRFWYNFLTTSEMDFYAKTSPQSHARILRDYTRFFAEVRDTIKAEYGITVRPILTLSSAAMGCSYNWGTGVLDCAYRSRSGPGDDTWPLTAAYYQATLEMLTRPLDIDFDGDGQTTSAYETWTQVDVDNFLAFFQYYSLDPFINHPLGSDSLVGQPGQPQPTHLDDYATKFADRLRQTAQRFYDLPACWNPLSSRYEACRRPMVLPQFAARYYSYRGQFWVGMPCPTSGPGRVCDDTDRYPYDDIRFNTVYSLAREVQTLTRELDRNPGHIAAWAYWQAADELHVLDPVSRRMWGSLEATVEPALDWDRVCVDGLCQNLNTRFTPLGEVYLAAAARQFTFHPGPFRYVGNNDGVSGSADLLLERPAWWR